MRFDRKDLRDSKMTRYWLLFCSLISFPGSLLGTPLKPPIYPQTFSEDHTEVIFGEIVSDPFRWLESDIRSSPNVATWVSEQNAATDEFLDQLAYRKWFSQKIEELMSFERFGIPRKANGKYFFLRNSGLQNQSQLFVQDAVSDQRRLLLDPNSWANDGSIALADWEPSPDGSLLAYSVQLDGSDWRSIRVLDVETGNLLSDKVDWAKFTAIKWINNESFLYSRFPRPDNGEDFRALNYNQSIYLHAIGTNQEADVKIFSTPDFPDRNHSADVTDDGRWAVITSSLGTDDLHQVSLIDLTERNNSRWQTVTLVPGFEHSWSLIASLRGTLYFLTNSGAPKFRIVSINLNHRRPEWRLVVPQTEDPISGASIVGNKLIIEYLRNASTRAVLLDIDDNAASLIELTGLGTASGFSGSPRDPETFYSFESFNRPETIYSLNLETGETTPFAIPELTFNPDKYLIEQRFFSSTDGTAIPIFIVRSRNLAIQNQAAPTLLYGYGGFDVSMTPRFNTVRMAWLEAGGVFALANIRGGGEYGREWHESGRRLNKQNGFDDFIRAAEFLKLNGYTTENGLAIEGRSNGGLLVGAVTNQRPDLIDAAHAAVGVMDMLRFDLFTAGRYWTDDYGDPDDEEDFLNLLSYSPYHNIREGEEYPAIIVTTADTDDRVVPGHSFKYVAALQNSEIGDEPKIIRIEAMAGHGSGKPTDKIIAEGADVLAFLAHYTGLEIQLQSVP